MAANLEAAIVFARSVTFHLQSQFAHAPGFPAWYTEEQAGLSARPLCRFLLQQRNFVLKVGPAAVSRVISLSLTESVIGYAEVSVKIIRGQPWYRRSPKILIEDLVYPLRQEWRLWKERRERARRARTRPRTEGTVTGDDFYFSGDDWAHTPALQLIDQHLEILDAVVYAAEKNFLPPTVNSKSAA